MSRYEDTLPDATNVRTCGAWSSMFCGWARPASVEEAFGVVVVAGGHRVEVGWRDPFRFGRRTVSLSASQTQLVVGCRISVELLVAHWSDGGLPHRSPGCKCWVDHSGARVVAGPFLVAALRTGRATFTVIWLSRNLPMGCSDSLSPGEWGSCCPDMQCRVGTAAGQGDPASGVDGVPPPVDMADVGPPQMNARCHQLHTRLSLIR